MSNLKNGGIVIPARINSTRLPRKLLLEIDGKPIIQHTWEQCCKVGCDVFVATDSMEISKLIESLGGNVWYSTKPSKNGTHRTVQAAESLGMEFVVNVQGG